MLELGLSRLSRTTRPELSTVTRILTRTCPRIVLREPTFDEYLAVGDPYSIAFTALGTPFEVESPEVVRRYIEMCLVEPQDPAILKQAGAFVAREVKNKLLGFFQPDVEMESDSANLETISPSPASEATPSTPSES